MADGKILHIDDSGHQAWETVETALATALGGRVPVPGSPTAFTINGAAPAASATLPAALGTPSLTLLSDVITYAATLQTRVDLLEGVIQRIVLILRAGGQAT